MKVAQYTLKVKYGMRNAKPQHNIENKTFKTLIIKQTRNLNGLTNRIKIILHIIKFLLIHILYWQK